MHSNTNKNNNLSIKWGKLLLYTFICFEIAHPLYKFIKIVHNKVEEIRATIKNK